MRTLTLTLLLTLSGCTTSKSDEAELARPGAATPIAGRAVAEQGNGPEVLVLRPDEMPSITLCLTGANSSRFAVGDVVMISGAWKSAPALAGEQCMVFDAESIEPTPLPPG